METISSRIYRKLSSDIINGVLKSGQRLEETVLAKEFGVSRTPIREALRDLGARGLVEFSPRRGGVVAGIGYDKLADLLEAQCELEALCARLSSQRMSSIEKSQLEDIHERARTPVQQNDVTEFFTLNEEFHRHICIGSHNKTLRKLIGELRDRLAPYRQVQSISDKDRLQRSDQEHSTIVDAIVNSEAEQAYEAMRTHNGRISSGVLRIIQNRATP